MEPSTEGVLLTSEVKLERENEIIREILFLTETCLNAAGFFADYDRLDMEC